MRELTDKEILLNLQPIFDQFHAALRADPEWVILLAEAAAATRRGERASPSGPFQATLPATRYLPGPRARKFSNGTKTALKTAAAKIQDSDLTGRALTAFRDEEVIRLAGLGIPQFVIAEALDMKCQTVAAIEKRHGHQRRTTPARNPAVVAERSRRILELHSQGLTQDAIAKELGIGQGTVSRRIKADTHA